MRATEKNESFAPVCIWTKMIQIVFMHDVCSIHLGLRQFHPTCRSPGMAFATLSELDDDIVGDLQIRHVDQNPFNSRKRTLCYTSSFLDKMHLVGSAD